MSAQATETGPDLSDARRAIEALMDDQCEVTAPVDPEDWVLDADLRLVPPPDAEPLYSGPCKFGPEGGKPGTSAPGGVQLSSTGQQVDFPLDRLVDGDLAVTPVFPAGSAVTITASRRDPLSVGTVLVVTAPVLKTMAVKRSVLAERRDRVEP